MAPQRSAQSLSNHTDIPDGRHPMRLHSALVTLVAVFGIVESTHAFTSEPSLDRKNILVIVLDDVGVDKIGAYGEHPDAPPTPNMDALASQGVMFRRFWTHPNCSPARVSLLTGRYAFRHGIGTAITYVAPGVGMSLNEVTIPEVIPHRNVALGKWHVQTQTQGLSHPNDSGFDIFAGTPAQVYTIGLNTGYSQWLKNINGTTVLSTEYATTDTANDTINAISGGLIEPWFVVTNFQAGHKPLHVPPQELHTQGEPEGSVGQYAAMIEAMDTEIGRILDVTDLQDTVVVLFGDNGTLGEVTTPPFNPDHGKKTPYEGGIRVPLIIAGPNVAVGGECNALTQIQDLFPTIIEIAGEQAPPSDGISMRPYLRNPTREPLRDWVYTERFAPNGVNFGSFGGVWNRCIRDDRYKIIQRNAINKVEFYDLENDPFELVDLAELGPLSEQEQVSFDALVAVLDELEAEAKNQ